MYPKVKVRDQEQDDLQAYYDRISLQAFQSLCLHDSSSPVAEHKDDYTPPIVRTARTHISRSTKATIPASQGAEKTINKTDREENKPNIKPCSVLPPRAVLSSPDNDAKIRNIKKMRAELVSGLKNHNACQNRHIQCKVIPRSNISTMKSPVNTRRESKEAADGKNELPGTTHLVIASQRGKQPSGER